MYQYLLESVKTSVQFHGMKYYDQGHYQGILSISVSATIDGSLSFSLERFLISKICVTIDGNNMDEIYR